MNKNVIISFSLLLLCITPLKIHASDKISNDIPVLVSPITKEELFNDPLVLVNKEHGLTKDYVPRDLRKVNVFGSKGKDQLRDIAASQLENMFSDAKKNGHTLFASSGYRSYERQKEIYSANVRKYGKAYAETFSAPPGHSEHQTGLVMDISSKNTNYRLTEKFASLPEGKWVRENAWKYGFVIRYPKDKTHITKYRFEPWHLRYIGHDAAKVSYEEGLVLEELIGR